MKNGFTLHSFKYSLQVTLHREVITCPQLKHFKQFGNSPQCYIFKCFFATLKLLHKTSVITNTQFLESSLTIFKLVKLSMYIIIVYTRNNIVMYIN